MNSYEEQINNDLSQFEEQEQLNHIRWLLNNQTKRSFYYDKNNNDGISEWINNKTDLSVNKNKRLLRYLKSKKSDHQKKYTYLLDPLNEQQNSFFQKYANIPAYTVRKQKSPQAVSPKKVTLKLPYPHFLEQASSCSQMKQLENKILPTIKRSALNFMRKQENKKNKSIDKITRYPLLFRQHSEAQQKSSEEVSRKGRMMGSTKRQLKSFSFTKPDKEVSKDSRLQQCLTFIK